MKKLRLAAISAVGALAASAGLLFPGSAQAATTYWQFQNANYLTCLTAGDTGTAFATSCVGSYRQQWDFVGDGTYKRLVNRETGTCLASDNETDTNAVWTSTCTGDFGQLWKYDTATGYIVDDIGERYEGHLRTSTVPNAVYATDHPQTGIPEDDFGWYGTHD